MSVPWCACPPMPWRRRSRPLAGAAVWVALGVMIVSLAGVAQALPLPLGTMFSTAAVLASSPPVDNLLVNGSFEDPAIRAPDGYRNFVRTGMPGWRINRGSVDMVHARYWPAAPGQGSQSLDLTGTPGAATIEQSFSTEPGRYYLFSGWVGHNPENPVAVEGRIDVSLNGKPFTQLFHSDPLATLEEMHWTSFAYWFRATAATTTLTLSDVTPSQGLSGALLDGLSVTAGPVLTLPLTPSPATGLGARSLSPPQVVLTWFDNSRNETGFEVWRKEVGGDWVRIALAPPNIPRFVDNGLQQKTMYTYRVRAVNNIYPSVWSNEVRLTTPVSP